LVVFLARPFRRSFVISLGLLLGGYAFFGRTLANVGYPPIFPGGLALAFGILVAIGCGAWRRLLCSPLVWMTALFAAWGCWRTLPFLSIYGMDALRDSVIWGYGIFLVLTAVCIRSEDIHQGL